MYTRCDYCNSDRALPMHLIDGKSIYMCLDCKNLLDEYVNKIDNTLLNDWSEKNNLSIRATLDYEQAKKITKKILKLRDAITKIQLEWLDNHRQ